MNLIVELQNINYMAVVISAIASYVLGFTWYHWEVFGEAWANALNITKEEAENTEGLGGAFIMSLISGLLKAIFVALLMAISNVSGFLNGAFFGVLISAVFIVTSLGYYNGFARVPSKLTLINSTHSVVELCLMGAIIGMFS